MRLFVAFNLSESERAEVHAAAAPLRERDLPVRWTPPKNLHVTLKFLGEVKPEAVEKVERALKKVAMDNDHFELGVSGFGAFPTIRRPRVIWVGVDASPAVRCLKQDIEWALADCGYDRETRAFHPHITLGRVEEGGAGAFRGLDDVMANLDYRAAFPVRSVELMRSHLSASGPRYSVVSSSTLSGNT